MIIGVSHESGVCWKIVYSHRKGTSITKAEIKAILSLYGEWREYEGSVVGTIWTLNDKDLAAFLGDVRTNETVPVKALCIYDRRREIRKGIEEEINAKIKARKDGL
jgi:hypothetical protein